MAQDTLLGFPAHTLPYRRGEFATLLTVSEQPHQVGLLLFALVYLLTRKRVKVFLDRYLIRYFVLCKLISDILRNYFLVPPYCIHIVAFALKLPIPILVLQIRMSVKYHQRAFPFEISHKL